MRNVSATSQRYSSVCRYTVASYSTLPYFQGILNKLREDMEIYRLLNIFDETSSVYNVVQRRT